MSIDILVAFERGSDLLLQFFPDALIAADIEDDG